MDLEHLFHQVSGQTIIEEKLINCIIDGIYPKYNPVVIYIRTKLDSTIESNSLAYVKFMLQKYK